MNHSVGLVHKGLLALTSKFGCQ